MITCINFLITAFDELIAAYVAHQAALFAIDQHFDSGMQRVSVFVSASCIHKNVCTYMCMFTVSHNCTRYQER